MTEYRDTLPVIVDREQAAMPDWCDSWGIKSVRPDLSTYGGYRWPWPGGVAECDPAQILRSNDSACPGRPGDGLCVATTWRGMASGGIPARTLLLVAYASGEVLGRDDYAGKLRLPRVHVAALVDGGRLLREAGHCADLRDADLAGADLTGANLAGADLTGANLAGANLARANLAGANLASAELTEAYLRGANLARANLAGANLAGANLRGAYLAHAYLAHANLTDANLTGANLTDAYLADAYLALAYLTGAYLAGANLTGARMPEGWSQE